MESVHDPAVRAAIAARTGYGRLLALLAARTGDIAAAEDALSDAFERALRTWPERGVPDNPEAWLLSVGRNRLRDTWRSAEVQRTTALDANRDDAGYFDDLDVDAVGDKRLELMLVCSHPAIAVNDRAPLMLNTVLGFTAEQIARSFTIPAPTMSTRLTRVKRRIRDAGIPFRIPDRSQLAERMDALLEAMYAAYVIEWSSTAATERALPPEALQLVEVLATLAPADPEVRGLAALVELSAARRLARTDAAGRFVPLGAQDRSRWDWALIDQAHEHLRAAHEHRVLGRFQVEAAIQALHCARVETGPPDPIALRELHEVLVSLAPTLGSKVALAAAVAEVDGSAAGLTSWIPSPTRSAASSLTGPPAPPCSRDCTAPTTPAPPTTKPSRSPTTRPSAAT